jgi:hypothetical protein
MITIFLVLLTTLISTPAFAYIDPGSSGFILQAIIGALAAGVVALKTYWHRLLSLFAKLKKKAPSKVTSASPQKRS